MRLLAIFSLVLSFTVSAADVETLVIVGINDFHGALAPSPNKDGTVTGGAVSMAAQIREIERSHPGRVLILDAGDEWQGTLDSNLVEGASVVNFYNSLGVDAAAIGNHEFDFGPVGEGEPPGYDPLGAIKVRFAEAKFPYLSANIIEKKTGKRPDWPNTRPSAMLTAGKLKVGVIGLTTRSTRVTTRGKYVESLEFTDMREATLREARELRGQGAHVVVVVAHAGLRCELDHPMPPPKELSWKEKTRQPGCAPGEEIMELAKQLPRGTVDAIVAGHTHQITHHWVQDVPVIQSGAHGKYFSKLVLNYDFESRKVLGERTEITGPIEIKGKTDPEAEKLLAETFRKTTPLKERLITKIARAVKHERFAESEIANLVTDAFRWKTGADVAMMNPGGVRVAGWNAGPFTYESLFRTLPFDNFVSLLKVTGAELLNIVRVANSGKRGYFAFSGLVIEALGPDEKGRGSDLNGDGTVEHWEHDKLVSVKTADGKPIDPRRMYTFSTIDFIVEGGDDLGWAMSQIPKERITLDTGRIMREAVEEYLATRKEWNTERAPALDPKKPRLIFAKGAAQP